MLHLENLRTLNTDKGNLVGSFSPIANFERSGSAYRPDLLTKNYGPHAKVLSNSFGIAALGMPRETFTPQEAESLIDENLKFVGASRKPGFEYLFVDSSTVGLHNISQGDGEIMARERPVVQVIICRPTQAAGGNLANLSEAINPGMPHSAVGQPPVDPINQSFSGGFPPNFRKAGLEHLLEGVRVSPFHSYQPHIGPMTEVAEVLQGEFAVTSSNSRFPVLATYGVGPCVGVAGWDSNRKVAFLCHFDAQACVLSSQDSILDHLRRSSVSEGFSGELTIFSGMSTVRDRITQNVIELFRRDFGPAFKFQISNQNLGSSLEAGGLALAVDSRNGSMMTYRPMMNPFLREPLFGVAADAAEYSRVLGEPLSLAHSIYLEKGGIITACMRHADARS